MTDLTPESEALLEDVHGTQMALVVYPARLAAIEAAAAARATAPLLAERDALRRDLATFTEEPGILARVGAQHTTYWYNQTRVADERARKAEAERDALRAVAARFMETFEETGVHEHERDDDSIDLCIPIAPLKPVYWAACAALGHRWTVVDVEPFCERCGWREGDDDDDAYVAPMGESHSAALTPPAPAASGDLSVGTMSDAEWEAFQPAEPEGGAA